MDDSFEWRPPFEEMELEFLEFSLVGFHWKVFQLDPHINPILNSHPSARILLGT